MFVYENCSCTKKNDNLYIYLLFIKNLSWNILTLIFFVFYFYLYALFYRFFYGLNVYHLISKYFFSNYHFDKNKISVNNIFLAKYFFNAKFCFLIAKTLFKTSVQNKCYFCLSFFFQRNWKRIYEYLFQFLTNFLKKWFYTMTIYNVKFINLFLQT